MVSPITLAKPNVQPTLEAVADYFGLQVQVITRLSCCSVICYRDREFIVATEDLQNCLLIKLAA